MKYSSRQVCERTGLTYRMLDYWLRTGLLVASVPASGPGTRRQFSDADLSLAMMLASLRKSGYTLNYLRQFAAAEQSTAA